MDTIHLVLAITVILLPIVGAILRHLGKKDAADVLDAIGEGIDEIKTVLPADQAKLVTNAIRTATSKKAIGHTTALAILDATLKARGRNVKTRDELIAGSPTPPPAPPAS